MLYTTVALRNGTRSGRCRILNEAGPLKDDIYSQLFGENPILPLSDHLIPTMSTIPRNKWWNLKWFADDDSKEDRRLISKIDMFLVPYSVLGYWVKYIDQSNLNNAYVAGMKEDLGFYGNELVQLQTLFTLGSVLGQIPFL